MRLLEKKPVNPFWNENRFWCEKWARQHRYNALCRSRIELLMAFNAKECLKAKLVNKTSGENLIKNLQLKSYEKLMFEIVFNFLAVLIHDFRLNFSESAGHPQPLWQMDTRPSPLAWDIRKKNLISQKTCKTMAGFESVKSLASSRLVNGCNLAIKRGVSLLD